jgi:hypothetical protein
MEELIGKVASDLGLSQAALEQKFRRAKKRDYPLPTITRIKNKNGGPDRVLVSLEEVKQWLEGYTTSAITFRQTSHLRSSQSN